MNRTVFIRLSIALILFSALFVGLVLILVGTAQKEMQYQPTIRVQNTMPPKLTALSAYVFDVQTGVPLYAYEENTQRPIASVTKLISSALFYAQASGTASTTVLQSDVRTEGRSGRLEAGQEYQNSMFLFPALLESSNDASVVMRRVTPTDLVQEMNQYTKKQGLLQTTFSDTSGLSDTNVSTAKELAAVSTQLKKEYPYIFDITRLKTYLNHINAWMNNNPFVRDNAYRGGKHGYTTAANHTAVAFFDEQLQKGGVRTVGYVLLGSDTLQTDMKNLRTFVQQSVTFE